jgi:hypothetical protein
MAKGLKALYLLEAKCKRKLERVRRKIKATDAGGSPSSEDSALEELAPKVKKEPVSSSSDEDAGDGDDAIDTAKVVLPEATEGLDEAVVKHEGVGQEVVGDGNVMVVKQENVVEVAGAAAAVNVEQTIAAMRTKSPNYYTKTMGEGGTKVFKCRRCHNSGSTTSHSWDDFCSAVRC